MVCSGNDAVELFELLTIIDIYGNPDENGSQKSWEYEDSWAYKETWDTDSKTKKQCSICFCVCSVFIQNYFHKHTIVFGFIAICRILFFVLFNIRILDSRWFWLCSWITK